MAMSDTLTWRSPASYIGRRGFVRECANDQYLRDNRAPVSVRATDLAFGAGCTSIFHGTRTAAKMGCSLSPWDEAAPRIAGRPTTSVPLARSMFRRLAFLGVPLKFVRDPREYPGHSRIADLRSEAAALLLKFL
jgi:hypothetical protein